MEMEKIEMPKQVMDSIRIIIKKTRLYKDEKDFVQQAVMKQMMKFKEV